jgi:alkylhydroperoxidase family enzyme
LNNTNIRSYYGGIASFMDRLDPFDIGASAMKALVLFGGSGHSKVLDPHLIELVKARTLQLTGGRYGEAQCKRIAERTPSLATRIACLQDWYTSREFSTGERAALLWAEDVVYATTRGIPDLSYMDAAREFPPDELWALTVTIVSMCAWAQIAQAFHITESIG